MKQFWIRKGPISPSINKLAAFHKNRLLYLLFFIIGANRAKELKCKIHLIGMLRKKLWE